MNELLNVIGEPLICCCKQPRTGYFRDGFCRTDQSDKGSHTVCAQVTEEFLEFSKQQGNDLYTPRPEYQFPGLKHGDLWCLCALRWIEAYHAGLAPPIKLEACHHSLLNYIPLKIIKKYSL